MPLKSEKLLYLTQTLRAFIYRDAVTVQWRIHDHLPVGAALPDADAPGWRDLEPGALWGSRLSWAWLTASITFPPAFDGQPVTLHAVFDVLHDSPEGKLFTAPEALLTVTELDTPPQALNSHHRDALLTDNAAAGQTITLALACFTGVSQPGNHQVRFAISDVAHIDRDVEGLYWDAIVLLESIAVLPDDAPEKGFYLRALQEAFNHINWLNPPDEAFLDGVRAARATLHDRVFAQPPAAWRFTPRPTLHAVGHAHIDVAWLWPLKVTRGKAARTFATALALMDQYPEYRFTQSQPHLYKMVEEDDPDLFTRIKARIAEGRWNPTGGTWVEPDTFMPGSEALVRQFLYGMRYFERVLGVRPEALWLPDVFGYSAALPQIIKLAGMHYFFTSKLSWNKYTRFPYETFWWEGLDGTRILTHLATTPELAVRPHDIERTTYNSALTPQEVIETWTRYLQKDDNHHLLVAFGMGDGGGGPNRDMLERRARMSDLPGMPRVIHSTVEDFFHALEETIPNDLPAWVGELYLQMHLGTFTSQARTKRHNRKSEVLLHDTEALASTAFLLEGTYPHDTLNAAWETVLLHQFHDILPGSSITPVYEDTERDYAAAQQKAQSALDQALDTLARHVRWDEDMEGFVVFNTLGMTQGGPIELTLPGEGPVEIVGPSGRHKAYQWIDEAARRVLVLPNTIPAYGHKAYIVRSVAQTTPVPVYGPVEGTSERLENEFLRAEFSANGNLIRLYDREFGRDVLEESRIGNQLWAYVDRPPKWDAWDVEPYVRDQGWRLEADSVRLVEAGPLRATLEMTYTFNNSKIVQRVSLLTGHRTLRFDTEVDWHERHIMLKVLFPVAIRATHASYETQFGTVQRPTHTNTAWDFAQHEVPAQQWIDLSEAGYGVSLLNDCKYGHSVRDNVLAMSLLRAPTHPDPEADQGQHQFTYALYPHGSDWRNKTITQARRLNHPLHVRMLDGGGTWLPVVWGLVTCDSPGVVIDTIKKAEDGNSLIVRVYEAYGGRTTATIGFSARVQSAEEVNLLEEPLGPVDVLGDTLRFSLTPFQIRSFRVALADIVEHQLG